MNSFMEQTNASNICQFSTPQRRTALWAGLVVGFLKSSCLLRLFILQAFHLCNFENRERIDKSCANSGFWVESFPALSPEKESFICEVRCKIGDLPFQTILVTSYPPHLPKDFPRSIVNTSPRKQGGDPATGAKPRTASAAFSFAFCLASQAISSDLLSRCSCDFLWSN